METYNRKLRRLAVAFLSALVLLLAVVVPVSAAATTQGGAGFYVYARLPENQQNKNLSYFDLRVRPGQTQNLIVEITNEQNTPISVSVAAISASTNRNGIIDYKTPDIRDKTLRTPFSSIATVKETIIVVAGNSTKTASIAIALPEKPFDGVILGGLVFTRLENDAEPEETTAIRNAFSYVLGVKLTQTDAEVLPEFEVTEVISEPVNYRPAFTHVIRNSKAAIAKNIQLEATVSDAHGTVYASVCKDTVDMAPNSVMPLAAFITDGTLIPGSYISDLRLEYDGKVSTYRIPFTVSAADADRVNDESIGDTAPQSDLYRILFFAALVLILLLLLVLILTQTLSRRNKKHRSQRQPKNSLEAERDNAHL